MEPVVKPVFQWFFLQQDKLGKANTQTETSMFFFEH